MNGTQVSSMTVPSQGQAGPAPNSATPLSSAPVLAQADGLFPSGASGRTQGDSGSPVLGGAMLAGPDRATQSPGVNPSGGFGTFGPLAAASTGSLFTHA
jgi:hypothetical protein